MGLCILAGDCGNGWLRGHLVLRQGRLPLHPAFTPKDGGSTMVVAIHVTNHVSRCPPGGQTSAPSVTVLAVSGRVGMLRLA